MRAALPRELMRRTICCAGDFGDTASSPGLNLVSTLSRFCGFRRKNDGHDNLNRDFRVLIVPGVRGVSGGVQAFKRVCRKWTSCAVILGGAPKNGAASQTLNLAFVSLDVEVMVVEIGDRASSRSEPVLFRAFR